VIGDLRAKPFLPLITQINADHPWGELLQQLARSQKNIEKHLFRQLAGLRILLRGMIGTQ
jgi:hypothetical protein